MTFYLGCEITHTVSVLASNYLLFQDKWYPGMIKIQNGKELCWWLKQFKQFYLTWKPTALDKFVVQEHHLVDESI